MARLAEVGAATVFGVEHYIAASALGLVAAASSVVQGTVAEMELGAVANSVVVYWSSDGPFAPCEEADWMKL